MRVKVIINPAAGQAEPILSVLNDVFGRAGIEWDVAITHKSGDGLIAARAAAGDRATTSSAPTAATEASRKWSPGWQTVARRSCCCQAAQATLWPQTSVSRSDLQRPPHWP